jgi:hypothetical protein
MDKPYCIFVSCGTPFNDAQDAFLTAVEAHLKSHNCEPQTVGRSKFSARQPVQAARDLIAECDGAMLIAFERTLIVEGVEKPNSASASAVSNETHPTVWNQMEGAMAYARRVPILTIVQNGVKRQGMLSNRLEWGAIECDIATDMLRGEEFRQVFADWFSCVVKHREATENRQVDVSQLRVGEILRSMKPSQLYAAITFIILIISTFSGISFKLGQAMRPPQPAPSAISQPATR